MDNRANRCWRLETRIPDPRLAPQVENDWLVRYAIYLDNCQCGCFGGVRKAKAKSKERREKEERRMAEMRKSAVVVVVVVVDVVIMGGRQGK